MPLFFCRWFFSHIAWVKLSKSISKSIIFVFEALDLSLYIDKFLFVLIFFAYYTILFVFNALLCHLVSTLHNLFKEGLIFGRHTFLSIFQAFVKSFLELFNFTIKFFLRVKVLLLFLVVILLEACLFIAFVLLFLSEHTNFNTAGSGCLLFDKFLDILF